MLLNDIDLLKDLTKGNHSEVSLIKNIKKEKKRKKLKKIFYNSKVL